MLLYLVYTHMRLDDPINPPEMQTAELEGQRVPVHLATMFVPNRHILPKEVLFSSTNAYLRVLKDGTVEVGDIKLRLVGSSPSHITPENREGRFAYFGSRKDVSNVPMYRSIRFKEVYKGVDFVLNGLQNGTLEYYFYVRPGGSLDNLVMEIKGGELHIKYGEVFVKKNGRLIFHIKRPQAFQGAEEVEASFVKVGPNRIGFNLKGYNKDLPVVIDPTVVLAGPSYEKVTDIVVGDDGSVYAVGFTRDYINFAGGYDRIFGTSYMDSASVFVTKLSPDLTTLVANVIVSGSRRDYGWQIILGGDGTLYIGASTNSPDYAPFRTVFGTSSSGSFDVAVTRLDTSLMTHLSTAIVSGVDHDLFRAITIAADNSIYITGYTYNSSNFAPTRVVHGTTGWIDVFITRLSHDLSSHLGTAIVSGSSNEGAYGIVTDGSGVYVVGSTNSSNIAPSRTVWGSPGGWDSFVTKVSLDLSTHLATVVITSLTDDVLYKPEIDPSGNLIVMGRTYDPTTLSESRTIWGTPGNEDVFLTRMSSDLSTHLATTVIASPDSAFIRYRNFTLRGDTAFVLINVTDPTSWGGTACPVCNYASGGGPWDDIVVGVTSDLSTCIGKSIITGAGEEDVFSIKVKGNDIYVGAFLYDFDTTLLSTYPQPAAVYGYPWDLDGFVIKARPQCLVGVDENVPRNRKDEVIATSDKIVLRIYGASYVGYDLYTPDGRRVKAVSLGYLQPGTYTFPLKLRRGVYFIKVRVGEKLRVLRIVK